MKFDFYATADLLDEGLIYHSEDPFITSWKYKDKEVIKFLDTMNIFPFALKEVGEIIEIPKQELPEQFKTGEIPTKEAIEKAIPYYSEGCGCVNV